MRGATGNIMAKMEKLAHVSKQRSVSFAATDDTNTTVQTNQTHKESGRYVGRQTKILQIAHRCTCT